MVPLMATVVTNIEKDNLHESTFLLSEESDILSNTLKVVW
jgi:hypothetical protein